MLKHPQERLGETLTDFEELIWAAGLFEGEGCLTYVTTANRWEFKIQMTDVDVMEHYASLFDMKVNGPYSRENKKDIYQVKTAGKDKVFKMVCDFYPYLGERRREKCDEFLQWYAAKTGKRYD